MAHPVIVADECIGCGICVDACPQEVLEVNGGVVEAVNEENCIERGPCLYIGKGLVAYEGSIRGSGRAARRARPSACNGRNVRCEDGRASPVPAFEWARGLAPNVL